MTRLFSAERVLEHLQPRLFALISHHKAKSGSTMLAVKATARATGVSEKWIRRVTGRYGEVKVQAHQFFNVVRAYLAMRKEKRRARKAAVAVSMEARV